MLLNKIKIVFLAFFLFVINGCVNNKSITVNSKNENIDNINSLKILTFKNNDEFIKKCIELIDTTLSKRNEIKIFENFVSLLDVYDRLYSIKSKKDYLKFINKNKDLIDFENLENEGNVENYALKPKINFIFSCFVNKNGFIEIENQIFNLIECKSKLNELETLLNSYILSQKKTDTSSIVTIPEYLVTFIPMCKLVVIPIIYPTKYFKTTINDQEIIIQLWKGYYPGIFGFPDGIGAEVGLYRPLSWTKNLWLPDYKNEKNISYKLILNNTNEVIISVSKTTWWLNSWEQNYYDLPLKGKEYRLEFSVDSLTWTW